MIYNNDELQSFKLKKSKNLKIEIAFWILVVLIFFIIYLILRDKISEYKLEKEETLSAVSYCNKVYNNGIISDNISLNEVDECVKKVDKVNNEDIKNSFKDIMKETSYYITLRDEINSHFNLDVVNSNVTLDDVNNLENKLNNIVEINKKNLVLKINNMREQVQKINNLEVLVNEMYQTDEKSKLKSNLTREEYNKCVEAYEQVVQQDVKDKYKQYIDNADKYLSEIEEKIRIQKAWVVLKVPYISQNKSGVYNGCEAASLLMGLKYKGFLSDMDLVTYSNNMPKSNDPNSGFYLSIFSLEPKTEAHWIAPAPLTNYAKASSGNNNVIDATGWSLDQLTQEIINGNPVVVYLTYDFLKPRSWSKGAPQNLHVQLLTGYNKITKKYIITDPWTRWSGKYEFTLNKNDLEYIYNAVGKKAVVVR